MPAQRIMDRLQSGERLLIDGGTGSELQRRGVDMMVAHKGPETLYPWAATANLDAPEVVQQVHADYLRVGADIIISNSFWTNPIRLAPAGMGDRWEEYARASVELAVKARDAGNLEAYVAGGMAPPTMYRDAGNTESDVVNMGEEALHRLFADEARVLADSGADLILPEYVGNIDDCVVAVDASATTGLPVFLGIRGTTPGERISPSSELGRLWSGETMEELVEALKGHKVDAILLMCQRPEGISAGLPALRSAFDGLVGGYPNIGYVGAPDTPWLSTVEYTPMRLAKYAGEWRDMGAEIIGGCCGTGPEHITAMRPAVKGA